MRFDQTRNKITFAFVAHYRYLTLNREANHRPLRETQGVSSMAYFFLSLLYFIWAVARCAFVALLVRAGIACRWHIAEIALHFAVSATYCVVWYTH